MSIKKKQLKSGSKYCFTLRYTDIYGNTKQYTSKGYDTKKEADMEEAKFRIKVAENKINISNVTFNQIFIEYLEYRKKDMKVQSLKKLENLYNIFEPIGETKINDFNLQKYKQFKLYIDSKGYSVEYNNKIIGLIRNKKYN